MADAVLLTILGVPQETVVSDYVLTNWYLKGKAVQNLQANFQGARASAKDAFAADPADLGISFEEVKRRFGSLDNYLHQGLGLTDATLNTIRKNYLAD